MPNDQMRFYSQEQAIKAIEELTEDDLIKLRQFARGAALVLSDSRLSEDDLINESIARTLDGDRNWNSKLSILNHLIGAMKSIASDSKRSKSVSSEVLTDNFVDVITRFENTGTSVAERDLSYDRLLAHLSKLFKSDPHALILIEGFIRGDKRNEIIARNNLTENEYGSARKRITRKLIKEDM